MKCHLHTCKHKGQCLPTVAEAAFTGIASPGAEGGSSLPSSPPGPHFPSEENTLDLYGNQSTPSCSDDEDYNSEEQLSNQLRIDAHADREYVKYHPFINGCPCNVQGEFLDEEEEAPPWDYPNHDEFYPFMDHEDFELVELLYAHAQMPKSNITNLLQILACKLANQDPDAEPPFVSCEDLYVMIDAIQEGDVCWECFTVSYKGEITEDNDTPWRHREYKIWYRHTLEVIKQQVSNRDFAKEMDFAPKIVTDKDGTHRYRDLMSRRWAWWQADILAQDEANYGAVSCPVILGSDKTTVSVATSQNDYYPVYMSNGLIHNNICHAHCNGITLVAFLAIPKSTSF
ncbi:hypothetical protein APHAL10511_004246 [Amanita phalloides]|nr:hypothetical protein APHAL10511_004246 [Amanita phalloides]